MEDLSQTAEAHEVGDADREVEDVGVTEVLVQTIEERVVEREEVERANFSAYSMATCSAPEYSGWPCSATCAYSSSVTLVPPTAGAATPVRYGTD